MKFITPFITLFTATATYAISLDGRVLPKISENGTETDSIEGSNTVKCISYVTDCLPFEEDSYSFEKIDAFCNGYNSKICQDFYEDPVSALEECQKVPHFEKKNIQKYYSNYLDDVKAHSKLYCQKTEDNQYCPLNVLNLFRGSEPIDNNLLNNIPEEKDLQNAINETCTSKSCYDAAFEFFTSLNNSNNTSSDNDDKLSKLTELSQVALNTLNEESCKQKANASAKANTKANAKDKSASSRSIDVSGAISYKSYNIFNSLILVLVFMLF